jgi:hypothetical protein
MLTHIAKVFCNINFNGYNTFIMLELVMASRRDLQLFNTSDLTCYHFYFEGLISLALEVNNLCVYITLLLHSCNYNKIYEYHNNHDQKATYWIFNILFRDLERSISRLKYSVLAWIICDRVIKTGLNMC